ncbi:phospholipid-transporting ATPase VD [Patella vulgata]|uniref:phospholipid-transporting ATPase VD n=1 Tax=Patella vulgata TaxID=6465 RepID=UPI0024A8C1C3|nr:phospholipid-transporting ATPase VD [Patella vulgata]
MGNIMQRGKTKPKYRTIVPNCTVDPEIPHSHKSHPNHGYLSNKIQTTRYSVITFLPKNLFEQFHRYANLYFLFVVALNWVPEVNAFAKEITMLPVIFVLGVTCIKDAYEDFRRYRSDKKVNFHNCRKFSCTEKRYVKTDWHDIHVGDFVHLSCNEIIPADILLLRSSDKEGICHIETCNIDGENNLKQRYSVKGLDTKGSEFDPSGFRNNIEVEQPNCDIYKFKGYIFENEENKIALNTDNLLLRGCVIRNTDFIEGICVYAGHETKALLNNRGPRYKRSKLERAINRDVVWCVVLLLFLCFFCAIGKINNHDVEYNNVAYILIENVEFLENH